MLQGLDLQLEILVSRADLCIADQASHIPLLQLACDELRRERIVRPSLTRLERLVATARQQAHEETFRRLGALLTGERHTWLDGLLQPDPETGRTLLQWLRRDETSQAASQIVETLEKLAFLLTAGVDAWELERLNPNRMKWLAQMGWKAPTQQLRRMGPMRHDPILCHRPDPAAAHTRLAR